MSAGCPARKGRGGEGSLASASEPSVLRRIGDGERDSIVLLDDEFFTSATRPVGNDDDEFFTSTTRPGGKSFGGSVTSISPSAGKRVGTGYISTTRCGAEGSLSSNGRERFFTSTTRPGGNSLSGSVASISPSAGKRVGTGYISTTMCGAEGSLSSNGRERFFTSTTRPAANGLGGEGS